MQWLQTRLSLLNCSANSIRAGSYFVSLSLQPLYSLKQVQDSHILSFPC